jgi:hypothetical protein
LCTTSVPTGPFSHPRTLPDWSPNSGSCRHPQQLIIALLVSYLLHRVSYLVCKLMTLLPASWLAAKELPPCPPWLYVPEIFYNFFGW